MLRRRLSLLQAVSVNMAMMVGVGPFITIPLFVKSMGGPQAIVGWVLGALIAICDGLVWSELAAAFPGSGGTYHFFDEVYGTRRLGRLLKFLFVWQFLFSAPLELASGALGLAQYTNYLIGGLDSPVWTITLFEDDSQLTWQVNRGQILAVLFMAGIVAMAYRGVESAGRMMVVLWAGMLATVGFVIASCLARFQPSLAFTYPAGAWTMDRAWFSGLGIALGIAMYDFLGYYQICYLGDEVSDPARTIPRSILIAVVAVAALYLTMNLGILGVMPWQEVAASEHIASDVMSRLYSPRVAQVVTLMILWTGLAATFAAILSYSRVPYAAARSGHFFSALAAVHPSGHFPHRSLALVGLLAMLACLASLQTVIEALLASRILIQFVGQIVTVAYIRTRPDLSARLSFRMILYPIPACIALAGWLYVFGSSSPQVMLYGLGSMALGLIVFAFWDRRPSIVK
jgi:amino acid transporter